MRIGAHVSSSGGLDLALDRAHEIGAEAIQIFGASPQSWRRTNHTPEKKALFIQKSRDWGIAPVFIHAIYLINLATENEENLKKGIAALSADLALAGEIGAQGVIFHIGSHRGVGLEGKLGQIAQAMQTALADSPGRPQLCIENCAGMGDSIGSRFADIGRIMQAVGSPRVKVCLDTQHSFASGYYNLADRDGLARAMEEFEREIGLEHLVAVHANDSKCPFGGGLDRHENIGAGHIGTEGFANIMAHTAFKELPFLLEVPGFEKQGPDAQNVALLKQVRERAGGQGEGLE
ncbi:MAG: deoxyribonuclease IV [Dehalococcoidia bacterium]|nr:deoxyribonuclease IV [Dehalococcoidia bacterium]